VRLLRARRIAEHFNEAGQVDAGLSHHRSLVLGIFGSQLQANPYRPVGSNIGDVERQPVHAPRFGGCRRQVRCGAPVAAGLRDGEPLLPQVVADDETLDGPAHDGCIGILRQGELSQKGH
jgi:hypothetical protein